MKVNPFKFPKLKSDSQKNAFPLSHTESFTAPFGALLPCSFYHLTAGSKFRVDMENQTIMTPIIRPPFSRMFEHFEFFAVPMCQLHQAFDNFITGQSSYENSAVMRFNQRNDDEVAVGLGSVPAAVPTFTGRALEWAFYYLQNKDDVFGCRKTFNSARLLDLLGYGNFYQLINEDDSLEVPTELSGSDDPSLYPQLYLRNLLPQNFYNLLAYQKIYYSHYCNTKYESIETQAFNIDDIEQSTVYNGSAANDLMDKRFQKMLELHYRWKSRDYFTCVQPSVLPSQDDLGFRYLSTMPNNGLGEWQLFGLPGTASVRNLGYPDVNDDTGIHNDLTSSEGNAVAFADEANPALLTVASIRFSFAWDKLLRRMRVAGTDFNSQMLAQFGIAPSDARHGAAKYLGGYTNQLRFDEVTASAQTETTALGDIAGKLSTYAQNRRTIEYTAKEDTIIMCIYSTSVDCQYHSFNQSRENLRRFRFDWFNPAFQNLGLQALFAAEYSYISDQTPRDKSGVEIATNTDLKKCLGFVPRYLEYKTKVNRVHGLLQWPYNNPLHKQTSAQLP